MAFFSRRCGVIWEERVMARRPSSGKGVSERPESPSCRTENDPLLTGSERERQTGMTRIPAERRVP